MEADGDVVGLGLGGENGARDEIAEEAIGEGEGLASLFEGVGGEAENAVGAEGSAGFGDGGIVLADMEARTLNGEGEGEVVVDDEGNGKLLANGGDEAGETGAVGRGFFFCPDLEDARAA